MIASGVCHLCKYKFFLFEDFVLLLGQFTVLLALALRLEGFTLDLTFNRLSSGGGTDLGSSAKSLAMPHSGPFPVLLGSIILCPLDEGAPFFICRSSASEGGIAAGPTPSMVSSSTTPSTLHTLQSRLVATSTGSSLPGIF